MDKNQQLELDIADTIIDRPKGFSVGHRHFYLYPVTLGKLYLQKRVIDDLGIDQSILKADPYIESLRLVEQNKEKCCLLLAYHTLQTKKDILSNRIVSMRKRLLLRELDNTDIAALVLSCLSYDKSNLFIHYLGIDEELKRMKEVSDIKDNKNTFIFGGKSVYGTLIDAACERYKWTYDYVVWEISYINLQMMMRDKITSIYLTDEEIKNTHINNTFSFVDGNNKELIINAIQGGTWN